ncbi:unnamed protein product [Prorocentrum cordatum]|uniref:Uncharacterized protein n=1 Tax=Prorocentrum cordatum TaxID=2364126 RepID=A0ABN9RHS5_9DINO|nr:unnamed protein product [Polarella glacialis]
MKCLRWAGNMTNALQTAARTLRTLDSFNTPEREYSELAEQLSIIKEALRDFWGVTLDSCSTALRRLEQVDKLEALSETCSTASGCASEASSEADCDSPRGCRSCEAPSASPDLADEICKGGRPCSPSGAWTALMHWA